MDKNFSAVIKEIMPLVEAGDNSTPFVISRNKDGSWDVHYPYPADSVGSLLSVRKEHDPYTAKYFGTDFDGGSMPYVHDKILCDRLRCEYYERGDDETLSGADKKRLRALINFFEDNINSFSHTVTDYLTELEQPFRALEKMCPFNMATNWPGWTFNEDLAADAVDHIENAAERLRHSKAESVLIGKRVIEGDVFEYGGRHWRPHRKFEKRDGDFYKQMDHASSDRSLGIATYDWGKTEYSHALFYAASGESEADIFRCVENGRLYIPCENELFQYNEPPQKGKYSPECAKTKQNEPPGLLDELDDAKAELSARNAAPKDKPQTKKRGEAEI
jgi:hypothetical protein